MTASQPNAWLIRTADNRIQGPFSLEHIRQLIQDGKLHLNDEVCHANNYWFYLHESEEIKRQLGIELPKELYANPEEPTQTETEIDIDLEPPSEPRRVETRPEENETLPELSEAIEEIGENTAVMSNRAFREFRQGKRSESDLSKTAIHVHVVTPDHPSPAIIRARKLPHVEKSKLVHWFTYLMMVGAVALLVTVIKLLNQQPNH